MSAENTDRQLVVDLLAQAFDQNRSVNYIVKQDRHRLRRIRALMEYAFDFCLRFGAVYITPGGEACALIAHREKEVVDLEHINWQIRFIRRTIGPFGVAKALARERRIKELHPRRPELYTHLWFIGVAPAHQGKGIGTALLQQVLADSQLASRPVYLETSTLENLPWYERAGFEVFHQLDFGFPLYLLKKESL